MEREAFTMSNFDEYTKYCQKILKNKNWYPWKFEVAVGGIICTGAECPKIVRGSKKGQPNFRERDKSTENRIFIPKKSLAKMKLI
jgi:hypothetical protein